MSIGESIGARSLEMRRAHPRRLTPRLVLRGAFFALTLGIVVVFAFPYYWMLSTSLKLPSELWLMPPTWAPTQFYLGSYTTIFVTKPFLVNMRNSLIVASTTMVVALIVGSLAAYALARLPIKGRALFLAVVLSANMFPGTSIIGPLFIVISNAGLINSYPGLIWPYTSFTLPFTIWVLTNFYSQIPLELEEAAQVDGCSPLQAFYRVILPLASPGLATVAILVFISAWNEFLFALTFTRNDTVRTIPVAIASLTGVYDDIPWGEVSAAAVIVTLPLVALAIIFQKRIVQGLTAGAVKG